MDTGKNDQDDHHGDGRGPKVVADLIQPLDDHIYPRDGQTDNHNRQSGVALDPPVVDGLRQKKRPQIVGHCPEGVQSHQLQGRQENIDLLILIDRLPEGGIDAEVVHRQKSGGQDPKHQQNHSDRQQLPVQRSVLPLLSVDYRLCFHRRPLFSLFFLYFILWERLCHLSALI